ncbi:unnamed protein product [Rotaria magnacalcarata]|uniref:Uncharacterized protein n=1 Tax=Rotaria magnacalcarata TaxID=392030 RepID=A0A8S3HW55_9BILA|nr:unnamed protein product [Rotaria magnacalcarata]
MSTWQQHVLSNWRTNDRNNGSKSEETPREGLGEINHTSELTIDFGTYIITTASFSINDFKLSKDDKKRKWIHFSGSTIDSKCHWKFYDFLVLKLIMSTLKNEAYKQINHTELHYYSCDSC